MITIDKIKAGALNYIDVEICGKLHDWRKWVVAAVAVTGSTQIDNIINKYGDIIKSLGYMDDTGMIDIDKLYNDMLATAERQGAITQNIPLLGDIKFDKTDIQKLYEAITRA